MFPAVAAAKKGYWSFPSGFVDAGEDPKLTAERECMEETGLVVKNIQLLDVIFNQDHPRGASILIIYQGEVESGQLKAGDDANQAVYFKVNNLPPLAFGSTQQILASFF